MKHQDKEEKKSTRIITVRPNGSVRVQKKFTLPTKTQQHHAEMVNVNKIMAKYKRTGQIDHLRNNPGVYADFTEIGSYEDALNKVIESNNVFNKLPANLRNMFENNPQKFLEFLQDPDNDAKAIKLGLKIKTPEPNIEPTNEPQPVVDTKKD